jgi:hypothetical protein
MGPLSAEEARQLAKHLSRPIPAGPATIAEIFNPGDQSKDSVSDKRRCIGFHADILT